VLDSRDFVPQWSASHGTTTARYEVEGGVVSVTLAPFKTGIDFSARLSGLPKDVIDFGLLPDLQFSAVGVRRLLFPSFLGVALKPGFFAPPPDFANWQGGEGIGPDGLRRVASLECSIAAQNGVHAAVQVTDVGRKLLGESLSRRWEVREVVASRSAKSPPEQVLLSTSDGEYLAGHAVGQGWLYRFAGAVEPEESDLAAETVGRLLATLGKERAGRKHVVLIALAHGPSNGGWSATSLATWRQTLPESLGEAGLDVVFAGSAESLRSALSDPQTFAIVNPYGEAVPLISASPEPTLDALARYLRGGGIWVATGGYPFYTTLRATHKTEISENYPSRGFSDFARLETAKGFIDFYGVQDEHHIFVPSHWQAEGGDTLGHLQRSWRTFVPQHQDWITPHVRLDAAPDALEAIHGYAAANGIVRPLASKMTPQLLETWKRAVHVKVDTLGYAGDLAAVMRLPSGVLIHSADYLHGGFDKQYPDFLPPNPAWGSPAQLTAYIQAIHDRGDLFMPYTNDTWWCDEPRGPTFLRVGEGPLLHDVDGKPVREQYGRNPGWIISSFHPAVIAATDESTRGFTEDYRADILFQDQTGARGMEVDTNPASPTAYAYTQGLMNLAARSAKRIPIATEDGFDRLANVESEFCGLAQNLGATALQRGIPRMADRFDDDQWEFYPIAEATAHDKAFFIHHDLEPGLQREADLAWALALGYGLSTEVDGSNLNDPVHLGWIERLTDVQKKLGPLYMGAPLRSFRYLAGSGDHGVMEAVYGHLRIVSNLSGDPFMDGSTPIAAGTFRATVAGS